MVKFFMKNWNWIRVAGLVSAVFLIAFGSLGNMLRTIKFGLEKIYKG